MSTCHIREASLKDCEAMLAIESACFKTDRIPARQMRYLLSKAKALNLVLEHQGKIVGCCVTLLPKQPRPARLYSIAVLPAEQGKGFASDLLTYLIASLAEKNYQYCRLEVRASDIATQKLYERFGFEKIAETSGYYEDGESAVKMQTLIQTAITVKQRA